MNSINCIQYTFDYTWCKRDIHEKSVYIHLIHYLPSTLELATKPMYLAWHAAHLVLSVSESFAVLVPLAPGEGDSPAGCSRDSDVRHERQADLGPTVQWTCSIQNQ